MPRKLANPLDSGAEFLTIDEVATVLRISVSTVRRLSKAGSIPRPIVLGKQIHRWKRADIEAFIVEKSLLASL